MNEELATGAIPTADLVSRFRAYLDAEEVERGWIALELGDALVDRINRVAFPTIAQKAQLDGTITAGVWRTRNFSADDAREDVLTLGPQLFVAEGEIPSFQGDGSPNPQAQDWPELVEALDEFDIPKAVATSYTPFRTPAGLPSQALARPLIEAGWYCLPYVYPSEHVGVTVEQQITYAQHYGPEWGAGAEPVLGVYGGYTVDSPAFDGKEDRPGYSLWDAGEVL